MNKKFLLIFVIATFMCFFILNSQVKADCIGATTNFTCGDTVTESCTLNQSEPEHNDSCFIINANDTIIDCNGYNLTGNGSIDSSGKGFIGTNLDNVTIKDCIIVDFDYGIWINYSTHLIIYNNTLTSNQYGGIGLNATSYSNLSSNIASQNRLYSFYIGYNSSHNFIYNNLFNSSQLVGGGANGRSFCS